MGRFSRDFSGLALALLAGAVAWAQPSGKVEYFEPYAVEGLNVGGFVAPKSWQYKRYNCRPSDQYTDSTWCTYRETRDGVTKSLTIMHLYNNVVTYVNKEVSPALFADGDIEREIERLTRTFKSNPHVFKSPDRPGQSVGLIVTWGDVELQQLGQGDLAMLAQGKSPQRGVLVDYIMNFAQSARQGLPVYALRGGAGFVWIVGADAKGEAHLRFFAADRSAMKHVNLPGDEDLQNTARPPTGAETKRNAPAETPKEKMTTSGTGFFVAKDGYVVTNAHVVEGCENPNIATGHPPVSVGRVLARDTVNDLALIKTDIRPSAIGTLRAGARIGEEIAVYGYPLIGILSSKGNFTIGNVSAVAGMSDDTRYLQISAPVQPGNSGGPALDQSGNVIGVVVAKLDAMKVAEAIRDMPQNVNFAIKTTVLLNFLDANGVSYATGAAGAAINSADLAERGKAMSVLIVCEK
jgi:hypothetical protein